MWALRKGPEETGLLHISATLEAWEVAEASVSP